MGQKRDLAWFEDTGGGTIALSVGIDGVDTIEHDIPAGILEENFDTVEQRREFILGQLRSMAFQVSLMWGEEQ